MNKIYRIRIIRSDYSDPFWYLSDELNHCKMEKFEEIIIQKYGLLYHQPQMYEVVDQELFGLFLLEYGDKLILTEIT